MPILKTHKLPESPESDVFVDMGALENRGASNLSSGILVIRTPHQIP